MKTRDVVGIVIPTVAGAIAAILFLYMAVTRQDLLHLAAAVGLAVAVLLGIVQWARLGREQK